MATYAQVVGAESLVDAEGDFRLFMKTESQQFLPGVVRDASLVVYPPAKSTAYSFAPADPPLIFLPSENIEIRNSLKRIMNIMEMGIWKTKFVQERQSYRPRRSFLLFKEGRSTH